MNVGKSYLKSRIPERSPSCLTHPNTATASIDKNKFENKANRQWVKINVSKYTEEKKTDFFLETNPADCWKRVKKKHK